MHTIHSRIKSRNGQQPVHQNRPTGADKAGQKGEEAYMTCGKCKNCIPVDRCNGDCDCKAKGIEVSQDDDIRFYGEQNNEPCKLFVAAD